VNKPLSTIETLLAEFGGARDVPLFDVCSKYLSLSLTIAERKARTGALPVPAFRPGGRKTPWFVRIDDLARHLDERHEAAQKNWKLAQGFD
jgi:hypothetical protein